MNCSVAGIAIKNSLFLIAKRNPEGDSGGKWEFPGGKVEEGENLPQALIREFQEEFNITIKVGTELAQTQFIHNNKNYFLHAFEIFISNEDNTFVLNEHSEFKWASLAEIKTLSFVESDFKLLQDLEKCTG
ncbi:MAG: (deoxy)nucleoside triphosphate pyrophosphohydrolase [Treponemataceae bacterium]